jgi:hypothetical protein
MHRGLTLAGGAALGAGVLIGLAIRRRSRRRRSLRDERSLDLLDRSRRAAAV